MENLGIKLDQIIFQIINFFIIMFVLKKFLYKPITEFVKKQKVQQEEYYKISQEITNQKDYLDKLSNDQKIELKAIYDQTIEKANKEAKETINSARESAKTEGKRILSEYNSEALQTKDTIMMEAKNEIYSSAVEISEKLLKSSLTVEQKQKLMEMALGNLHNE